jgi:transcription-repair coupling factor (superfamily II helicase)
MKTFEEPLYDSSEFKSIKESLKCSNEAIQLTGNIDSQQVNLMSVITKDYKYSIVVTHNDKRAREIYEDYLLYDKNVIYYPPKDFIFFNADIHGNLTLTERLSAIKRIIEGEHLVIITTVDGLMDKLIPIDIIKDNLIIYEKYYL